MSPSSTSTYSKYPSDSPSRPASPTNTPTPSATPIPSGATPSGSPSLSPTPSSRVTPLYVVTVSVELPSKASPEAVENLQRALLRAIQDQLQDSLDDDAAALAAVEAATRSVAMASRADSTDSPPTFIYSFSVGLSPALLQLPSSRRMVRRALQATNVVDMGLSTLLESGFLLNRFCEAGIPDCFSLFSSGALALSANLIAAPPPLPSRSSAAGRLAAGLESGATLGIVLGVLCAALGAVFCLRHAKRSALKPPPLVTPPEILQLRSPSPAASRWEDSDVTSVATAASPTLATESLAAALAPHFISLCANEKVARTAALLRAHPSLTTACDSLGNTPLHIAAGRGSLPLLNLLLAAGCGAAVCARNGRGMGALSVAARGGHADAVVLLLSAGAVVGEADEAGDTALHHAALGGDGGTAAILLAAGADREAQDGMGLKAGELAANEGMAAVLRG